MDSWTDSQLALMKTGGNDKCNHYLQSKGINPRTPIKQKYESPAAQLYKEVLKARVAGLPEPTQLQTPIPRAPMAAAPASGPAQFMSSNNNPASRGPQDPNGMERLVGETDQQYIARQTRLREEARARMANKFGGSGSRMQGIGSDPNYSASRGGGGDPVDSIVAGFGSALSTVGSLAGSLVQEKNVQAIKSTGASFWGSLTAGVTTVASTLTAPEPAGGDGLADLQRQIASQKPRESKYAGFGSDQNGFYNANASNNSTATSGNFASPSAGASLQEAPGLPGEDRNGIARLTGESDEQYVMRQTRLRDEARARMQAKFGGGGLSSASSSAAPVNPPTNYTTPVAPSPPSWNAPAVTPVSNQFASLPKAPSSANAPRKQSSDDFFSAFGT
jgi:hypothetical protein